MNYGMRFMTLYMRQGSRPSPWKRNAKKQNGCLGKKKRRKAKSKGEKERYKHLNAELQRIARRDKTAFFSDQCKAIAENNRMGKTRELFKKIRNTNRTFHSSEVKVTQSCPTLCDPMDYIVYGILQARILEWVTISFSNALK